MDKLKDLRTVLEVMRGWLIVGSDEATTNAMDHLTTALKLTNEMIAERDAADLTALRARKRAGSATAKSPPSSTSASGR